MTKKTGETKVRYTVREIRLTVRLTAEDAERLERVRSKMSPYAPLSQGKAISAALKIADEKLSKGGGK